MEERDMKLTSELKILVIDSTWYSTRWDLERDTLNIVVSPPPKKS